MCSSMALRGGGASPARCVATTSPSTSEKHHPGLDPASAHAAAAGKWRKLRSGGFAVLYDKCSNLPALMFFPIRDLFTLPSTSTLLDRSIEPQVVTVLIMVFSKLELNLRRLLEEALWQQNQAMLDMGDLAMSRVTK